LLHPLGTYYGAVIDAEIFVLLFEHGLDVERTACSGLVLAARGGKIRACCALYGTVAKCADRVFRIVVPDS